MPSNESISIQRGCADLLKVLSDPTRLSVVRKLTAGPQRVGELNDTLGVEQSLLSHHLRVLREAGVVTTQRDGKSVVYSLSKSFSDGNREDSIDLGCCRLLFE